MRKGLKIALLVLGLGFVVMVLVPIFSGRPCPSYKTVCRSHLKEIGDALHQYAHNYKEFPPDLEILTREDLDYISPEALECPRDGGGYFYFGKGKTHLGPASEIIAFDRKGNHKEGRNILRLGAPSSGCTKKFSSANCRDPYTPTWPRRWQRKKAGRVGNFVAHARPTPIVPWATSCPPYAYAQRGVHCWENGIGGS